MNRVWYNMFMFYVRKYARIALPAMAEQFLQFLMGLVDAYLVAFLGLAAISGVAVATNILSVFQALFIALGAATSAVVARSHVRREKKRVAEQAMQAICLTLLVGLGLGGISLVFGERILLLLGTEKEVAQTGGLYLAIVGGASFLMGLMTALGGVFRAIGNNRLPLYTSLLSNLLNGVFSAIAVFGFRKGIVGVAIGTLLARLLTCVFLFVALPFSLPKPSWKLDKEIIRLALPSAGERWMMRAGDVVVVSLIVTLGTATVAGNAIGESLTQFNYMPVLGMATATLILVSQAVGQDQDQEVTALVRTGYWLSLGSMFVVALTIFGFGEWLAQLYSQDPVATQASRLVMFFSLIGTPVTAGTMIYTAAWQGIGQARLPFLATSIGMWGIRIGLGYVLTKVFPLGLSGIWIATLVDNLFRCLFLVIVFRRWQKRRLA